MNYQDEIDRIFAEHQKRVKQSIDRVFNPIIYGGFVVCAVCLVLLMVFP